MRLAALDVPADGPAVTMPEGSLSGRELRAAAAVVARELAGAERVAVWATSELATVVGVLGALAAGVAARAAQPEARDRRSSRTCSPTPSRTPCSRRRPPRCPTGSPASGGSRRAEREPGAGPLPDHPDERPALVIYTSGTTGPPKGVVLSRGARSPRNLDALADAWAWTGADVLAHALPLFHVHGLVLGVLGPLRLGGARAPPRRASTPAAAAAALGGGATMLFGVPTMYHRLAEAAERDPAIAAGLRGARLLVSGSARAPRRRPRPHRAS